MECGRARELLSDHYEGALAALLAGDLEAHLDTCQECRALRETLSDVVEALRSSVVEIEPPAGLAERAFAAAWGATARTAEPSPTPRLPMPAPLWLAAAASIAAIGLGILLTQGGWLDPGRAARHLVERSVNAGIYLLERKDRLVEDVRLLRVVIGTAFEGRLERVNDRVDDYKRLLEKRRDAERGQQERKDGAAAIRAPTRAADLLRGGPSFRTLPTANS